jgi:hypothetical protein
VLLSVLIWAFLKTILTLQTAEQLVHKHVLEEERRKIVARERAERAERDRIKKQLALDRLEVSKEEHHSSVCIG